MKFSLSEISTRIHASVEGEQNLTIHGVASLEDAEAGELTFAESDGFVDKAARSQAGAIVVGTEFPQLPGKTLLRVTQPRLAFLNIMELFKPIAAVRGIHPKAHLAEGAVLSEVITVDAYAVIDEGAKLGKSTWVGAGSYIGVDVVLGEGCVIGPNVSLLRGVTLHDRVTVHAGTVIGGDGFGYQWLQDHHHKIPQLGTVVIEDDVEIGCNCCIDRATLGETRIGRGTKIDNLVQVAHNDHIGADVVLVAQVGIAGSVTVGNGAVIGGQAAITDHVEIGPRARIGARSGVTKDVAAGETVLGAPARPIRQAKREFAGISRLPELRQRVQAQEESLRALAKRVQELECLDRD